MKEMTKSNWFHIVSLSLLVDTIFRPWDTFIISDNNKCKLQLADKINVCKWSGIFLVARDLKLRNKSDAENRKYCKLLISLSNIPGSPSCFYETLIPLNFTCWVFCFSKMPNVPSSGTASDYQHSINELTSNYTGQGKNFCYEISQTRLFIRDDRRIANMHTHYLHQTWHICSKLKYGVQGCSF